MRTRPFLALCLAGVIAPATAASGADFPRFEARTIDPHVGNVCYAVTVADVDGDGKPDAVAVAEDAVYWYANPSWEKHVLIKNVTERDNVCIQPHDIDGDGKVDFALGAGWQPANTRSGGTVQWLRRTDPKGEKLWDVIPIGSEPTIHRMRWGDLLGTGKKQLIVAPLQGRGTKGPNWGEGDGVRILVYTVPKDPAKDPWPVEAIKTDPSLHTTHNLQVVDWGVGPPDLLVAAWEGVFLIRKTGEPWESYRIGQGNQEASPFKGSSEVKLGTLTGGRHYFATIEPWHGSQVVVYSSRPGLVRRFGGELTRRVIDEPVAWGHAVWCADLDGDGDDELIVGQRDANKDASTRPKGPGIFVYDPKPGTSPLAFERHTIDDGGIGCEDLVAADLDGDGRPDLLAGGRSTHNVRVYFNRAR